LPLNFVYIFFCGGKLFSVMQCPHCLVDYHDSPTHFPIGNDADGEWYIRRHVCSKCLHSTFFLLGKQSQRMVWPKGTGRAPTPPEVPNDLKEDYEEACRVLADSPKSSAALGRRCLQYILRETEKVKHGDLDGEIQQVLDKGKLPTHIAESIDAVRTTGNFAAHPIKSKSTGEIVPVEPHEAEWNLEVVEMLFDFYYVQPALIRKKRAAHDAKLKDAGKRPLK
jgi:hypothetical protein